MIEEVIRVVKTASCSSLSERSTITYEIGGKEDKSIYIRLTENTGSGMFSKVWVPLAQIALQLSAADKPVTSRTIQPLYSGSVNSAGFLQAVLKHLGLIKNIEENSRSYIRTAPEKFTAEVLALLEKGPPPQKKPRKAPAESNPAEGA